MPPVRRSRHPVIVESIAMRRFISGLALAFLAIFLRGPLVAVFGNALSKGPGRYFDAIMDPDAVSALKLTLLVAAIAVPLNAVFGLAAAHLLARFEFRGKNALLSLIDLPFSVSPVIAGLIF